MSKKRPANNPQLDATLEEDQESHTHVLHPLEVMRNVYQQMEITFHDDDDTIFTCLNLENVEVQVICCGAPDDLASVIVNIPVPEALHDSGDCLTSSIR
jgi:hypothetical protein